MSRRPFTLALFFSILLALLSAAGCTEKVTLPTELPPGPTGPPLTPDSIQVIFTNRCTACHSGPTPFGGMDLSEGNSYANVVNVASGACAPLDRVEPFDPNNSCIVQRIEGTVQPRMPFGGAPLPPAEIAKIRGWISQGAPPTFASPAL